LLQFKIKVYSNNEPSN